MLIELSVTNFCSFKDETYFSMLKDQLSDELTDKPRINKKAAIFGNNAAGKSTVIKALKFLKHFISEPNYTERNPITHWDCGNEPTKFTIVFQNTHFRYRYQISIRSVGEYTEKILSRTFAFESIDESLERMDISKNNEKSDWKTIFTNRRDGKTVSQKWFDNNKKLESLKNKLFRLNKKNQYEENRRKNNEIGTPLGKTTLIPNDELEIIKKQIQEIEEDNLRIEQARKDFLPEIYTRTCLPSHIKVSRERYYNSLDDVQTWFSSSLIILDTGDFHYPMDNQYTISDLSELIRSFDIDIESVSWMDINNNKSKKNGQMTDYIKKFKKELSKKNTVRIEECRQFSIKHPVMTSVVILHDGELNRISYWCGKEKHELLAVHSKNGYVGTLNHESDGTRRIVELSSALLRTDSPKVFIIDELDRRLHSLLTRRFIQLYNSIPSENKQLIITTHETHVMTTELWSPGEIWFVDKYDGKSILNRLSNIDYPKDTCLEDAYISGQITHGIPGKLNELR